MSSDPHDHHAHDHDDDGQEVPSAIALRVKALESLLVEKGLVDPAALDALIDIYENKIGPRHGARVVARAWTDPTYKARLLADGSTAIAEVGFPVRSGRMWSWWRTPPASITWSFARYAPATLRRCWGCRRCGTSPRPTGRGR